MTSTLPRRLGRGTLFATVALLAVSQTGALAASPTPTNLDLTDDLVVLLLGGTTSDITCGDKGHGGGQGGTGCTTTTTTTTPETTTTVAETTTTTTVTSTTTSIAETTTTVASTTTTTAPDRTTTTTAPGSTTTTRPSGTTTTTTTTTIGSSGSGAGPPTDGLGSIDTAAMPSGMAGAVELMNSREPAEAVASGPPADMMPTGMLSGGLGRVLSPVLPPAVVTVVASPLVILEALARAFASSGQALIIPGFAFLFGFGVPGFRRRVDDAIG